jgi:hypothetical protein
MVTRSLQDERRAAGRTVPCQLEEGDGFTAILNCRPYGPPSTTPPTGRLQHERSRIARDARRDEGRPQRGAIGAEGHDQQSRATASFGCRDPRGDAALVDLGREGPDCLARDCCELV